MKGLNPYIYSYMKELNTVQSAIGNFVRLSMKIFGIEVNSKRQLPSIDDGLKPAYRHIIYEELKTGPQMRKSADVTGSCMSTTHPHGDASLKGPIANLVRWGISTGRGNHGKKMLRGEDIEPASMRYTEVRISDKYYNIFAPYLPYVPYIESECKGTEPEYLPTPIPLCLTSGTLGIGLGVNCRIPAFTVSSLLDAYLNDNPSLLEAPFGLVIDYDKSELDQLWTTGVGKIRYGLKVEGMYLDGSWGYMLSGSPELFKPNISKLERWEKDGKVFITDCTDKNGPKLFFGREYNIKSISHEDILDALNEAAWNTRTYRLTVGKADKAFLIPLYSWLDYTVTQYCGVIEEYKASNIEKRKFDIEVWKHLPEVAKLCYDHPELTPSDISSNLNIDIEVVKAILQKSINTLRRAESGDKIDKLNAEIEDFSRIIPTEQVVRVINEF